MPFVCWFGGGGSKDYREHSVREVFALKAEGPEHPYPQNSWKERAGMSPKTAQYEDGSAGKSTSTTSENNSIPRTHMVAGENWFMPAVFCPHACHGTSSYCTQTKEINAIKMFFKLGSSTCSAETKHQSIPKAQRPVSLATIKFQVNKRPWKTTLMVVIYPSHMCMHPHQHAHACAHIHAHTRIRRLVGL